MAPRGRQRIPTARGSPVGGAALGPREAPQRPTGLPAIRGTRGLRRWWEHIPRECLFHKNTYFNTQIVRCNAHAEASTRHVVSARTGMRGARAGPGPPQGWPRPRVPPAGLATPPGSAAAEPPLASLSSAPVRLGRASAPSQGTPSQSRFLGARGARGARGRPPCPPAAFAVQGPGSGSRGTGGGLAGAKPGSCSAFLRSLLHLTFTCSLTPS